MEKHKSMNMSGSIHTPVFPFTPFIYFTSHTAVLGTLNFQHWNFKNSKIRCDPYFSKAKNILS